MKLKLIGADTFTASKIVNEETGEMIDGVKSCTIKYEYPNVMANIEIRGISADCRIDTEANYIEGYNDCLIGKPPKFKKLAAITTEPVDDQWGDDEDP